jgi:hypothetical protein
MFEALQLYLLQWWHGALKAFRVVDLEQPNTPLQQAARLEALLQHVLQRVPSVEHHGNP